LSSFHHGKPQPTATSYLSAFATKLRFHETGSLKRYPIPKQKRLLLQTNLNPEHPILRSWFLLSSSFFLLPSFFLLLPSFFFLLSSSFFLLPSLFSPP
jgi:hypothetical protein